MPQGGVPLAVPPTPGVLTRVGQAARYVISAIKPDTWMSPLQPLVPLTPEVTDRAWDYPLGYNINYIPRIGHPVTFAELKNLSRSCEIARYCIETRKDQVSALSWSIAQKDLTLKNKKDKRIDAITEFFQTPDKVHDFHDWLRPILEELFVNDAVTIYRRKTKGGQLYALDQMSGSSIKPLIDDTGRRPLPPSPAYQQILKGVPKSDYSTEEMLYAPRNVLIETPYGFSPLEQMIIYAKQQIERATSQLYAFTMGSLPDGFLIAPKTFSPEQISAFDKKLNALLSGNLGVRRQLPVMPDGTDYKEVREPLLKDDFDEWLARIACAFFSLPPTPFIRQMNRSTAENAESMAKDEGIAPLLLWIKRKIDYIIAVDFKAPDLGFNWNTQVELDPLAQANIAKILATSGIKAINEIRADLGLDPVTGGDEPMLGTPTGWMGLPGSDVEAQQDERKLAMMPEPEPKPEGDEPPDGKQPAKKPAQKLGKAVRHTPLPFDHPTAAKAQRVIRRDVAAALTKARQSTLKHFKAHPITKLAKSDDEADAVDLSALIITKKLAAQLAEVADESGENVLTQLGVGDAEALTEVNTRAADWASDHAADLVTKITDVTREKIQSTITQALDEGWAQDELLDALKDDYAFSATRANLIAETETNTANNHGALQGGYVMAANGTKVVKQWLPADDPCDECQENADEGWIDLDEDFSSGDDAPTAHPRCLCTLIVLDSDDIDSLE